jgi:hypothetical protein
LIAQEFVAYRNRFDSASALRMARISWSNCSAMSVLNFVNSLTDLRRRLIHFCWSKMLLCIIRISSVCSRSCLRSPQC